MVNTTSIVHYGNTPKAQLLLIEILVFLTLVLSVFLFGVGIVRRRYRNTVLKVISSGAYVAITLLIPYIIGLMQDLYQTNQLISVWAALLVYVHSMLHKAFYSRMGSSLADIKFFFYFLYAFIMFRTSHHQVFLEPLCVIFFASLVNGMEITSTHAHLSKADAPITGTVRNGAHRHVDDAADPNTGGPLHHQYFEEEGCILSSTNDPTHHIKNKLYSLTLFYKLLDKIRGVGAPLFERSQRQLSANWLLDQNLSAVRCPFGVIEAELAYLYDFLYNKTCYITYRVPLRWLPMQHLPFIVGISWLVGIMFKHYDPKQQTTRIQYHKCDLDVLLSGFAVIVTIMLHLLQLIICFSSWWSKMLLLGPYISRRSWAKSNTLDRCIKVAVEVLLCPSRHELFKPWQRKLGQYSLVDSCSCMQGPGCKFLGYVLNLLTGNQFLKYGRKETKSVALSDKLKEVIIRTLQDPDHHFTSGIAILEASNLSSEAKRKLTRARNQLHTDAELILAWHIATSLCVVKVGKPEVDTDNFDLATTLSKYCAYLVAFAPNLLPGNPAITENICNLAIEEAYATLKNCESSTRYQRLLEIANEDNIGESEARQRANNNVLQQGAILGQVLITEVLNTEVISIEVLNTEVLNTEVLNTEVLNTEVLKTEMLNTEVLNTEVFSREVLNTEVLNTEVLNTEVLNTELLNTEVLNTEVLNTEVPNTETNDPSQMWKLLADFWIDKILCLAPNMYNDHAHLDRLGDGGEFITHLWALLFHVGIVDGQSFGNMPSMAGNGTRDPSAATSSA